MTSKKFFNSALNKVLNGKALTLLGLSFAMLALPLAAWAQAGTGSFEIQNDNLRDLYNNYRVAQPDNVPWAGSYFAYRNDGIAAHAAKYDKYFDQGSQAEKWERKNHSCSNVDSSLRDGCNGWWGHCNAWSAAGIKEKEPRDTLRASRMDFTVGDQKAYLTEMWMNSGSLFAGLTQKSTPTGDWIWNPDSEIARRTNRDGSTYYEAFWDVTPRTFFLIFTNYVGILRQGVVVDRFTGEQVWNQPIVGYRILPISQADITREDRDGRSLWVVNMAMKFYWANDNVGPEHVSSGFDIRRTSDSPSIDPPADDYSGRLLRFKLFVDGEISVGSDGKLEGAGRIVGDGVWYHQEHPQAFVNIDQSHPDFIWRPTEIAPGEGSANPYIDARHVYDLLGGSSQPPVANPPVATPPAVENNVYTFKLDQNDFGFFSRLFAGYQKKIQKVLEREGVKADVLSADRQGDVVVAQIRVLSGESRDRITQIFREAGIDVLN
jgi:hypothetical protein